MAQFVDNLLITLSLNATKFTAGVKGVARELGQLDQNIKKSGDRMQLFGSTVANAFAAGQVVRGIKSTIDAAAQLTNQIATAEQVFGDSFAAIDKFSDGAVEAVGLSKRAAIEATTFLAGLGKAAGIAEDQLADFSINLTKLAADLAAAFNTDVKDAVEAIQSGFSGSSVEPLRRYNVIINDTSLKAEYLALTGEKVNGVLTTQQRTLAFLSMLYKQTADYQGQWNRESDQALAAQQKLTAEFENFKATIGESLVPMFTTIVHGVTDMISAFDKLPKSVQGFIATVGSIGALTLGAQRAVSALSTSLLGFGMQAESVTRITRTMNIGIGVAAVAMAAYAFDAQQAADATERFNEEADKIAQARGADAINEFIKSFTELHHGDELTTAEQQFRKLAEQFPASAQVIRDAFAADPTAFDLLKQSVLYGDQADLTLQEMNDIIAETIKKLALQDQAQTNVNDALGDFNKEGADTKKVQAEINAAVDDTIAKFGTIAGQIGDMAEAWRAYEESLTDARDTTRIALAQFQTDKVQAMTDAFAEFLTGRAGGVTILDRLADVEGSFDDLIRIVRRNGGDIPDIFDLGSKRAANFREAIQTAADVVNEELNAAFERSDGDFGAIRDRVEELRTELQKGLGEVTGLDVDVPAEKAKLDALLEQILPTDAEIKVGLDLSQRAKNELLAQIAVEMTKGVLPKVGTQLEIDLATGKKSPREVIKNAQLIADQNKLHIDFQLDPVRGDKIKVDKALQIFATKERDAIKLGVEIEDLPKVGRKVLNVIANGPDGKSGWPKIGVGVENAQTAEEVDRMVGEVVPDRVDVPVYYYNASGIPFQTVPPGTTPGGLGAPRGAGPRALGFSGLSVPVASAAAVAPIYVQTTINANVLGSPYDIARTVDKAMRRNARVMPTRP